MRQVVKGEREMERQKAEMRRGGHGEKADLGWIRRVMPTKKRTELVDRNRRTRVMGR